MAGDENGMQIAIVIFDGVDEIDFIGPLEILRRAARLVAGVEVRLVALDPRSTVTAAHGLQFTPDALVDENCDLLIVPGGGWGSDAPVGIRQAIASGQLTPLIAQLHRRGAIVAGICTGTMALAGILAGRRATTHHAAQAELGACGVQVVDQRVVDDGDIVTCGGVTAALDLALHLARRLWGEAVAQTIETAMEYRAASN